MKLIIAGTNGMRASVELIDQLIAHYGLDVSEIVSGTGGEIDAAAEDWSEIYLNEDPKFFDSKWSSMGVGAGSERNLKMAQYADALLIVWDGKSSDVEELRENMEKLRKPVYETILRCP